MKTVNYPRQPNVALKLIAFAMFLSLLAACGGAPEPTSFQRVATLAAIDDKSGEPFGIAERNGEIFVSDGQNGRILKLSPGSRIAEFANGLDTPSGIAFDGEDNLFIADSGTSTVKKIDPSGTVSTVAGLENKRGFADGEASAATFNAPVGIAVDENGKIFVSDTYNDRIRLIENGVVRTLAGGQRGYVDGSGISAKFDTPLGIAVWQNKLLVADAGNRRLRVVEPDGNVWTLAGDGSYELRDGLPLLAGFVKPSAVAVSADGVIYIADGNAIRAIGRRAFAFVETVSGDRRGFRNGALYAAQFNRPSAIAFNSVGELLIADSDNGLVRKLTFADDSGGGWQSDKTVKAAPEQTPRTFTAEEFRDLHPPRWPFDPPDTKRDIAGTLGEIRGGLKDENSQAWFHNGLDIAGGYGETARFVRDEKVLDPMSADNFNTLRELLRMPTLGYVHIRLGRDRDNGIFGDERFIFNYDTANNALSSVRVPRGASFRAGEPIGTLNAMNHVHLVAGRNGSEMNALAALNLPGVSDKIAPVIEKVTLFDESWREIETKSDSSRKKLTGKTRIVAKAFDRMDGNPERRRLGLYRLGFTVKKTGSGMENEPAKAGTPNTWTITFDKMPTHDAVKTVYATDSHSGATGETIFNYIVTNTLDGERFGEGFIDPATFSAGQYTIRVYVADFFGNTASKDILVEIN